MHADPRQGVVDAQCQVHGLANLFVAGSSVFPAGGYANPTLTLVALALRLADHLKRQWLPKLSPALVPVLVPDAVELSLTATAGARLTTAP
jgi:choline dehydrogenase-like flavoprotein